MSPHAAKARGIFDRAAIAPIGGHEGIPEDQSLMGNAQPADENNEALISELSLFDAAAGEEDGGAGAAPGTEDLAMAWPDSRLVRSASMSSTGSGDAEDSEVRYIQHTHTEKTMLFKVGGWMIFLILGVFSTRSCVRAGCIH